jgi:hypothetical protein
MTHRSPRIALAALLAVLAGATPVAAGNWATARMDPAAETAAGLKATFGFTILQHGVTPAPWVTATFVATNLATGDQIRVPMRADDASGHFTTDVTFPDTGDWTWFVMLAELGTDQDGAGGSLTVLGLDEVVARRLGGLAGHLGGSLARLPVITHWLAEVATRSTSAG